MNYLNLTERNKSVTYAVIFAVLFVINIQAVVGATVQSGDIDLTSSNFQLSACDGPALDKIPKGQQVQITVKGKTQQYVGGSAIPSGYVVCDFSGLMGTVNKFINVAIAVGTLLSLGGFCYVGYLYITGSEKNISKAKGIFPKIFFGFIIMLAAWFIVYQILSWVGADSTFKALLSKPK